MKKLIIADDEPRIVRGLKRCLPWAKMGIELVGEADNGRKALEMAACLKPDIMFVDICMPFLNGLELIKRIKGILPSCIIIIITGHDEFEFAKEAIKLEVDDYILKPVNKEELRKTVERAIRQYDNEQKREKYVLKAENLINGSKREITNTFFNRWLENRLSNEEIKDYLDVLNINTAFRNGLFIIKILSLTDDTLYSEENPVYTSEGVLNFLEELLKDYDYQGIFEDSNKNFVCIINCSEKDLNLLYDKISDGLEKRLAKKTLISQMMMDNIFDLIPCYNQLTMELEEEYHVTPVVILAKDYIEKNYQKQDFTLNEVAEKIGISPAYLSRLVKKELGCTFVEYLTNVRIQKAIALMNNPNLKIYEVADRVGYSSQHYFSSAFKKVTGYSPFEFKTNKGR